MFLLRYCDYREAKGTEANTSEVRSGLKGIAEVTESRKKLGQGPQFSSIWRMECPPSMYESITMKRMDWSPHEYHLEAPWYFLETDLMGGVRSRHYGNNRKCHCSDRAAISNCRSSWDCSFWVAERQPIEAPAIADSWYLGDSRLHIWSMS